MSDFWKGFLAAIGLSWLFGDGEGGCGCGGCLTFIILGVCLILYSLGLLQ